jgi:hypothetical protein
MSDDKTDDIDIASFHSTFPPEPPLTPAERQRRVVQLCSSFLRNLAFFCAGLQGEVQRILLTPPHPQFEFWREAHVNFLDICVLEWCKLFADRKSEHHWRRVIDDHGRFEADLYATLSVTVDEFAKLIEKAKHYRDKFVAHLDEERTMHPPKLDLPKKSVVFLYGRLVPHATAKRLEQDFAQALQKAHTVYAEALVGGSHGGGEGR